MGDHRRFLFEKISPLQKFFPNRSETPTVKEELHDDGGPDMNCYIAELDEGNGILAVWVKAENARVPKVYDPKKHIFDPKLPNEFVGAPQKDIVNWLASAKSNN